MSNSFAFVTGAYLAWDAHLGSHYCPTATGEGECESGSEILRRLHTAAALLDRDERAYALQVAREWRWEDEAPYDAEPREQERGEE